jgi:hypothetical protein
MRPSVAHAGTRAFQINGPHHPECTVANNGQQRPPFEHARHVSGPVHVLSALRVSGWHWQAARIFRALTTERNSETSRSSVSGRARRHLGCVNVLVKHRETGGVTPRPQLETSRCRFRALRSPGPGPLNKFMPTRFKSGVGTWYYMHGERTWGRVVYIAGQVRPFKLLLLSHGTTYCAFSVWKPECVTMGTCGWHFEPATTHSAFVGTQAGRRRK